MLIAWSCPWNSAGRAPFPRPLDVVAVSVGDDLTAPLCSNCPHAVDAHESTGYCDDCKVCEPDEVASDSAIASAPNSESNIKWCGFLALTALRTIFALFWILLMVGLVSGTWTSGSEAGARLATVDCTQRSIVGSALKAGDLIVSWSQTEVASNYDVFETWTPTYALAKWLASPRGPVPKCPT